MDLRVGVVGTGIMGSDHARTLAGSVKGAVLLAVADKDGDRASAVASETRARVHAQARALIDDPDVEAVLIASPDETHEDLVLACLEAGKPVLCEKPLASTIAGCLRIVAAEAATGRRLVQVGFMRRFDPGYLAMKAALATGRPGAPLLMHCVHRNAIVPPSFDSGMLISNSAVHEIDVARWLLNDEFTSATVFRRTARGSTALVDPQFIVLETRAGVLVDIEVFVNAQYGYDVRAEMVCETRLRDTGASIAGACPLIRTAGVELCRRLARPLRRGVPKPAAVVDRLDPERRSRRSERLGRICLVGHGGSVPRSVSERWDDERSA